MAWFDDWQRLFKTIYRGSLPVIAISILHSCIFSYNPLIFTDACSYISTFVLQDDQLLEDSKTLGDCGFTNQTARPQAPATVGLAFRINGMSSLLLTVSTKKIDSALSQDWCNCMQICFPEETNVSLSPLPSRRDVRTAAHRGLLQPPGTSWCDEASGLW